MKTARLFWSALILAAVFAGCGPTHRTDPAATWNMAAAHQLSPDAAAFYGHYLALIDSVDYNNNTFTDPMYPWPLEKRVAWRSSLFAGGLALPSVALCETQRTREVLFNLHISVKALVSADVEAPYSEFDQPNVLLAQRALLAGLYTLVSGRNRYEPLCRDLVRQLSDRVAANAARGLPLLDTYDNTFHASVNYMALLAFRLHDRLFQTTFENLPGEAMKAAIREHLRDPATGLYYESYSLLFGAPMKELLPLENAAALAYGHLFEPEAAQAAWPQFKQRFEPALFAVTAKDIKSAFGLSGSAPLGGAPGALALSLLTARELGDEAWFARAARHLAGLGRPEIFDIEMRYTAFTEPENSLLLPYLFAGLVHAGWQTLLEHPWETQRNANFTTSF